MLADDGGLFEGFFKFPRSQTNPEKLRDPLKLTSPVSRTVTAIHMVDGHEETESAFLKVPHGWRVGPHHHPFSNFNGACGNWFFQTFDFHKAEPARSGGALHMGKKAEIRDVDPMIQAYLKKLHSFLGFNLFFIYPNLYHSMEPQAAEKSPSAVLPSFLIVAAYFHVRLTLRNFGCLASGHF
jgi:hypothetical protein